MYAHSLVGLLESLEICCRGQTEEEYIPGGGGDALPKPPRTGGGGCEATATTGQDKLQQNVDGHKQAVVRMLQVLLVLPPGISWLCVAFDPDS